MNKEPLSGLFIHNSAGWLMLTLSGRLILSALFVIVINALFLTLGLIGHFAEFIRKTDSPAAIKEFTAAFLHKSGRGERHCLFNKRSKEIVQSGTDRAFFLQHFFL